ncbi:MAG: MFS transporter [Pseudomonadota bacterium]
MSEAPPSADNAKGLDEPDIIDEARSPLSGMGSAMSAGATLLETAQSMMARKARRGVKVELPAYLSVQATWFIAFGLQMVLFPYLITNKLGLGGTELGFANLALSGPSVIFLLLGGVVAERASGKPLLMVLHLLASVPAFGLAFALASDNLSYPLMIAYGLALGTVGAFMMPARDSILNEVVERRGRVGSGVTLQQGIAFATLAQFGAQILGLILAGYADKMTKMPGWLGGFGVGPIDSWFLMAVQGSVLASGALLAFLLAKGRKVKTGRSGIGAAFGDIGEGFKVVAADPKLWAMTVLMFGVGIFVIGAFLVVLPIINRDVYGLSGDGIRDMFVMFWLGAFVSSVALSLFKNIKRQGRLLLTAQLLGSLSILPMMTKIPHEAFLLIVFVWGLSGGVSIAMSRSIVQDAAPKDQLARVLSIYQLGFMAGTPFGAAIMGWMVDAFGPYKIAIVPAAGMTILILWMAIRTPIWNLRNEAYQPKNK